MLKIEDTKKVIEYKGKQYDLSVPSAKEQTKFAVSVEKEKDHIKQCDLMVGFIVSLGIDKKVASQMTIPNLQAIIEYVSTTGKK